MQGEAQDIDSVLFSEEVIRHRIQELGIQIADEYSDLSPVVLCTLKGAFLFFADFVRAIQPCPKGLVVDFITAQSYGSDQVSSGAVKVNQWCTTDLTNRHVLLVDDICDTGITLKYVTDLLKKQCASIKTVVLLDKEERRNVAITPDFTCFKCPNEFVVGYGMDFDQRYRSLPFVGVLKQSAIDRIKQNGQET